MLIWLERDTFRKKKILTKITGDLKKINNYTLPFNIKLIKTKNNKINSIYT